MILKRKNKRKKSHLILLNVLLVIMRVSGVARAPSRRHTLKWCFSFTFRVTILFGSFTMNERPLIDLESMLVCLIQKESEKASPGNDPFCLSEGKTREKEITILAVNCDARIGLSSRLFFPLSRFLSSDAFFLESFHTS